MNNILVINNELNVIDNEYVSYKDNVITFKKNCDYDLIYENNVNITINVLDNVFVRLFIYSENIDINSLFFFFFLYLFKNNDKSDIINVVKKNVIKC